MPRCPSFISHADCFELGQELAFVGLRSAYEGVNMQFIGFVCQGLVAQLSSVEVHLKGWSGLRASVCVTGGGHFLLFGWELLR